MLTKCSRTMTKSVRTMEERQASQSNWPRRNSFTGHRCSINKEEINMYNCPVRFGELGDDWPMRCLLLSPDIGEDQQQETALEDAQEALAHTAGIVLNYLIDQNIPHNILITDEGMTLYIIPRKFDLLIDNIPFFTSFETL